MRKSTKTIIARRFIFIILFLIGNILQNTQGFFPEIFGIRAYFLISLTVCVGMFEREIAGAVFGLFAGALWDGVSGMGDGYNALFLMIIGALCGLLINLLMRNNLVTALLLNFMAHIIYITCYIIFFIIAEGVTDVTYLFLRYYLPSCIYSIIFTPIFYLLIRSIMNKTKVEE
ncbi:MAG: rod shape-determining protein MreD [Oscillospiraceae bacterium]